MQRYFTAFVCTLALALTNTFALASQTALCPGCPAPDPDGSVFDPSSCIGPTISSQTAARMFCRGATRVEIASFEYAERARICNTYTGCDQWRPLSPTKFMGGYTSRGYSYASYLTQGLVALNTLENGIRV